MSAYSFLDVHAVISGPGGAIPLGSGAGSSEEGITIEPTEDVSTMTVGADGEVMHSLHADKSAHLRVRLLKTSPVNALLQAMYNFQTSSGALHGRNTFTLTNIATGDSVSGTKVAFARGVPLTYGKIGGMNEWTFHIGRATRVLGFSI